MKESLISLYQSLAPACIALGSVGVAATFAFNNAIAHIRTHIYESESYGKVSKQIQSIDPSADAVRPLRILIWLTTAIRFLSLALAIYAAVSSRTNFWTVSAGLVFFVIWLSLFLVWLWSIWQHQKYEVEMTSHKALKQRDAAKIDSGLGTT